VIIHSFIYLFESDKIFNFSSLHAMMLWMQVPTLGTSPVFAGQHLGGPVRPPMGTNQPRRSRHDIADDARSTPVDFLGVDDAE